MAILAPEGECRLFRPDDITEPFILITALPGGSADLFTARYRIEVQTFSINDYNAARDSAKRCEQRILAAVGEDNGVACVDRASVETHPYPASYGDPNITRFIANYRLDMRRNP